MRFPYRAGNAELAHWWSGEHNFRDPKVTHIGALAGGPGVLFRSNAAAAVTLPEQLQGSFIPYVMLTGMTRGMAWFAENDRGWTQSKETPAVSVRREGETVLLTLEVISEPVTLGGRRTFSFGLHPTPVRPLRDDWRLRPDGISDVIPDTFSGNNLKGRRGPSSFNTYPEDDWESVKRRIAGEGLTKGAAGLAGLYRNDVESFEARFGREPKSFEVHVPGLYWDMQWTGLHPAHTREWAETWGLGHGDYQYYTPEFVDFASWAWDEWITKTDGFVRGVYLDDAWPAPQTGASSPVTYALPDGHIQPGYDFRGYRSRTKRMRQICLDHDLEPHLTVHTTHTNFIPYHSFFSLVLDGEDFYSTPPGQGDFIDHWPLDRMRFMHHDKSGLITIWLGWCGNSLDPDRWPAWTFRQQRAYAANLGLHDIDWLFGDGLFSRFRLRQPGTSFVPYWANTKLVEPRSLGNEVKVSAWRRPGKCLVLVVNVGNDNVVAALELFPAGMGFGDRPVE